MGRLAEFAGDEASGEQSRTFSFEDEGHTLGNALRSIISQYPGVEFCGYTVPHPAEAKMYLRIQMKGKERAVDALRQGLKDLEQVCNYISEEFSKLYEKR